MKKFLFYVISFISFISTSFANDNIVENYISNGTKYFSKGHSKAFDLNVEIKYPSNWVATEGLRPHIVQKFSSKNGSSCILQIRRLPQAFSYNDWLEATQNIKEMREAFFDINANDIKIIPTHYSGAPGDLIEFTQKTSQAGFTMFMNSIQHTLFYRDKMIALQCFTVGETKQVSQENMNILYPLFRAMGNDIILHNKYTDSEKTETQTRKSSRNTEIDHYFFIAGILVSIIFTWGFGLIVPLIIRFRFKKRLSKGTAVFIVSIVLLFQLIIAEILAGGRGNHRHTALFLVALVGYNIIVKKGKESKEDKK